MILFSTHFLFSLSFHPSPLNVSLSAFLMIKTLLLHSLTYSYPKQLKIREIMPFMHFQFQSALFLMLLTYCFKVIKFLLFIDLQTFVLPFWLQIHFLPFHTSYDIHQEVIKSQQLSNQAKMRQTSEYLFLAIAMNTLLSLLRSSVTKTHHFPPASFFPSQEFSFLNSASFE